MKCPHCGFTTRYLCEVCRKEYVMPWKPYPEYKPENSDLYLVTAYNPRTKDRWVQRDSYSVKDDEWQGIYVLAWMPIPEAYESEE